jgi:hypothetical protein
MWTGQSEKHRSIVPLNEWTSTVESDARQRSEEPGRPSLSHGPTAAHERRPSTQILKTSHFGPIYFGRILIFLKSKNLI